MSKYRLAKPEEIGGEIATIFTSLNAELVKKGIKREIAEKLTERVAGAASSYADGHCGALARVPGLPAVEG
ncbi:MAG: hypothetical protein IMF11_21990 [Proteobacteria bacterium]|nr:hypothetical protein [Pseudomonadota bacterium]